MSHYLSLNSSPQHHFVNAHCKHSFQTDSWHTLHRRHQTSLPRSDASLHEVLQRPPWLQFLAIIYRLVVLSSPRFVKSCQTTRRKSQVVMTQQASREAVFHSAHSLKTNKTTRSAASKLVEVPKFRNSGFFLNAYSDVLN